MDATHLYVNGLTLLALIGAVWKFAVVSAKLVHSQQQLEKDVEKLNKGLERLEAIPVLQQQVSQLHLITGKLMSDFPRMREQMAELRGENTGSWKRPPRDDK